MCDSELGLTYYNWRYYNTVEGCWITRDLSHYVKDIANLYKSVFNSPIFVIDILGYTSYSPRVLLYDVNYVNQQLGVLILNVKETFRRGELELKIEKNEPQAISNGGGFEYYWKDIKFIEFTEGKRNDYTYSAKIILRRKSRGSKQEVSSGTTSITIKIDGKNPSDRLTGSLQETLTSGGTKTSIDYGNSSPAEWDATVLFRRTCEGEMKATKIINNNIDILEDLEPHQFLDNPGMFQMNMDLELRIE